MRFRAFIEDHFPAATVGNKLSTVRSKRKVLAHHLLPFFGESELAAIGYAQIQDFIAAQLATLQPSSVREHVSVLRRFLSVAVKRELLAKLPEIEWPKVPAPTFRFLTFDQAAELVECAEVGRWRRMITIALRTGLRIGELLALRPDDVQLERGLLDVKRAIYRGVVGTPKGGRPRTVPLAPSALEALHFQIAEARVRYWPTLFHTTSSGARSALDRASTEAGVSPTIGWHVLRHTFASHLAMRGIPLRVIQELLGHASVTMTVRYAHLSPETISNAILCLEPGQKSSPWPGTEPRRFRARPESTLRARSSRFDPLPTSTSRERRPAEKCDSASTTASE
jgi:integrase